MNRTIAVNTRVLRVAGLSLADAALLGLAAVGSAHPGPVAGGVIHGCVNASTTGADAAGMVRVVDANAACKSNERALDWNAQGPQGPQGDKGDAGPQGPQGPSGIAKLTTRVVSFPVAPKGETQKVIQCEAGERATGGGFSMEDDMKILVSQPYPPVTREPTGWRVYLAKPTDGYALANVWVICAAG